MGRFKKTKIPAIAEDRAVSELLYTKDICTCEAIERQVLNRSRVLFRTLNPIILSLLLVISGMSLQAQSKENSGGQTQDTTCIDIWRPGNFQAIKVTQINADPPCPEFDRFTPSLYPAVTIANLEPASSDFFTSLPIGTGVEVIAGFDLEFAPDRQVISHEAIFTLEGGNNIGHIDPSTPGRGIEHRGSDSIFRKTGTADSVVRVPFRDRNGGIVRAESGRLIFEPEGRQSWFFGTRFKGDIELRGGRIGRNSVVSDRLRLVAGRGIELEPPNGSSLINNGVLELVGSGLIAGNAQPPFAPVLTNNGAVRKLGEGSSVLGQSALIWFDNSGSISINGGSLTMSLRSPSGTLGTSTFKNTFINANDAELEFAGGGAIFDNANLERSVNFKNFNARFINTSFSGRSEFLEDQINSADYNFNSVQATGPDDLIVLSGGELSSINFVDGGLAETGIIGNVRWRGGVANRFIFGDADDSDVYVMIVESDGSTGLAAQSNVSTFTNHDEIHFIGNGDVLEIRGGSQASITNTGVMRKASGGAETIMGGGGAFRIIDNSGKIVAESGTMEFRLGGGSHVSTFTDTHLVGMPGRILFSNGRPVFSDARLDGEIYFRGDGARFYRAELSGDLFLEQGRFMFEEIRPESEGIHLIGGTFESTRGLAGLRGEVFWHGGEMLDLDFGSPEMPVSSGSELILTGDFPKELTRTFINWETVTGSGQIEGNGEVINNGIIAPAAGERIEVSSDLTLQPSSELRLELASSSEPASIDHNGILDAAGTIRISYGAGFNGDFGPEPVGLQLIVADSIRFMFNDILLPPPGPFNASLETEIQPTSDGREALMLIARSGELGVDPKCVDMGNWPLGATGQSQPIVIENRGLAPVVIENLAFLGPDSEQFAIDDGNGTTCLGTELTDGEQCNILIEFNASEGGLDSTELVIETTLPSDPATIAVVASADIIFESNFDELECGVVL